MNPEIKRIMRLLLITSLLLGCLCCSPERELSEEQQAEKLYAEYYIRYLQDKKQLKAEATFKRSIDVDSARSIEPNGSIFLQNVQLTPVRIDKRNLRYQKEFNRVFEPEYNFKFVDDDEQVINHNIKMTSIPKFSIESNIGSKANGINIQWEGENLKKNEQLIILLSDANDKTSSFVIEGPTSKSSCVFPSTRMDALSNGKGYLYLVKTQKTEVEKEDMLIHTVVEYYSDKMNIEIVD